MRVLTETEGGGWCLSAATDALARACLYKTWILSFMSVGASICCAVDVAACFSLPHFLSSIYIAECLLSC